MKNFLLSILFLFLASFSTALYAQKRTSSFKNLNSTSNNNSKEADYQYKMMMKEVPPGKFPKTFEHDSLETSGYG